MWRARTPACRVAHSNGDTVCMSPECRDESRHWHARVRAPQAIVVALTLLSCGGTSRKRGLRKALATKSRARSTCPSGVVEIPNRADAGAGRARSRNCGRQGHGAPGRRRISGPGHPCVGKGRGNIRLRDFSVEGNRETAPTTLEMAPPENYFRSVVSGQRNPGGSRGGIGNLRSPSGRHVTNFAILVRAGLRGFTSPKVSVQDSGSRNAQGRNNLSGGF